MNLNCGTSGLAPNLFNACGAVSGYRFYIIQLLLSINFQSIHTNINS